MAVLGQADVEAGTAVVEKVDHGTPDAAASRSRTGSGSDDGGGADRPRLAHLPALDGLRGLAVAAVLLFHLERLDGGFLGVDLFFVLSGFLITSLLVVEHRSRGRIDLGRFWSRRARRLLPALLGLLVGVSLLLLTFTPEDQRGRFRGEALATLGYVANWHRMSIDLGYWDIFEQPSPLDHTWSLAIEEQFYVLWPLVAVAVLSLTLSGRGRRRSQGHDADSTVAVTLSEPGNGTALARDPGQADGNPQQLGAGPGGELEDDGSGQRTGTSRSHLTDEADVWLASTTPTGNADLATRDLPQPADRRTISRSGDRVRLLGWVALVGAAVSFGLMALTYSPIETDRAYYGTDTRIGATLLGAALALFSAGRGWGGWLRRYRGWVEAVGCLGLVWMAWSVVTVDGLSPWYYRGGLLVFAVAAVAVIQAVAGSPSASASASGQGQGPGAGTSLLGRVVGWAPLRGLGAISYGVYLWHWPVNVYVTPERANVDGWALDGIRLLVTLAVSLASFWLVEQPIRRGALRGRTLYAVSGGAVAVTLAAVLVATAGTRSAVGPGVGPGPVAGPGTGPVAEPGTDAGTDGSVAPEAGDQAALGFGPVPVEGSDNPYLFYPAEIPPDATRVLVVGDSGAYHLGPILAGEGVEAGFAVASSAPYWCNIAIPEGLVRFDSGEIMDRGNCQTERRAVLRDLVEEFRPDAVVYYLANAAGPGEMRVDGEWTMDCEPAYDDYLTRALQDDVDLLSAGGARVVFATSPYTHVVDERAEERTDCRNATFRRVAASRPNRTAVVDMNAFVAEQSDTGREMFMDIVHLSPDASRDVAHWLFPQLRQLTASGEP